MLRIAQSYSLYIDVVKNLKGVIFSRRYYLCAEQRNACIGINYYMYIYIMYVQFNGLISFTLLRLSNL